MRNVHQLTGSRCRCGGCDQTFNAVSTFDAHRIGSYSTRRCLTPDEMTARGWLRNDAGFWITGKRPVLTVAQPRISGDRIDPLPTQRGGALHGP